MGLVQTIAPTAEPIDPDEAKAHLRVTHEVEDDYIASLIVAAREYCEQRQWKAYMTQTWRLDLDAFPSSRAIELNPTPVQSVGSVKYFLEDDSEHTFNADNYFLDASSVPARLVLERSASWPSDTLRQANGVQVTFVAGYTDATKVPQRMKQVIFMLLAHWYENREAVSPGAVLPVPMAVESLLRMDQSRLFV